jgi:hypothetical protein
MSQTITGNNIIRDEFDDPTVTLAFSPREMSLLLTAMCEADRAMCNDKGLTTEQLRHWDALINYIKDQAFEYSA